METSGIKKFRSLIWKEIQMELDQNRSLDICNLV